LNPAELLWHELRQRYLSNRVYADLQELDLALEDAWRRLSEEPQRLRQLINFDWIQQALDSHNQGRNEAPDTS
ncbi:MAG: hypothetical protein RJA36_2578, partial [Pseudomonadota bacterium]